MKNNLNSSFYNFYFCKEEKRDLQRNKYNYKIDKACKFNSILHKYGNITIIIKLKEID